MNLKQKLARLVPLAPTSHRSSTSLAEPLAPTDAQAVVPGFAGRTPVPAGAAQSQLLLLGVGAVGTASSAAPVQANLFAGVEQTAAAGTRIRRALSALPRPGSGTGGQASAPTPAARRSVTPESRRTAELRLPVEPVTTASGLLHVRSLPHLPEHHHGTVLLAGAARVRPATISKLALDMGLAGVDFSRALFLDLETTGLAGGTGTLPVVVGLAWFEHGAFQMEQLFLRRPGEERPMLARVLERLSSASSVVTYNGKTFDWPLLRSRFVMNRMKAPAPPPHLDLLHCARRIFKWRGGGTRLADIEREVIGYHRVGDVDGAQIPELYFRYLRNGNAAPLVPVLEHNVHDIRLLAALLAHLAAQFETPAPASDPRDLLGYAQLAFRAEDLPQAAAFAGSVLSRLGPAVPGASRLGLRLQEASSTELCAEALMITARVALREGEPRIAAEALERALGHCRPRARADLHLALAKIHEHRLHDFAVALRHAARTGPAETELERAKRLERLARRAARAAPVG